MRIPKVALLFLTRGEMPFEATWAMWLGAAAAALPPEETYKVCKQDPVAWQAMQLTCSMLAGSPHALQRQALFSVYVHAPPSFEGYTASSLWSSALIKDRIVTQWGDHSLVAATRALLAEAYANPDNEWFVLLSESDVPLYDPYTFYLQLMSERQSRVNACPGGLQSMPHRWSPRMATPHLNASHWRKSSQWFALMRKHAGAIIRDAEVYDSFERYCRYAVDPDLGRIRDCFSDEHYIPTLFASLGLENEMACDSWGIAALDWGTGGAHPRTYTVADITPQLFQDIRGDSGAAERAQNTAQEVFIRCEDTQHPARVCGNTLARSPPARYAVMENAPKLTARKFSPETAGAVKDLFADCSNGLGMLGKSVCR